MFEAVAVDVLMNAVMASQLAIDVGNDAGLGGAGKIVRGNDLVAERGEDERMSGVEEVAATSIASAAAGDAYGACKRTGNCELAAGQPGVSPSPAHRLPRGEDEIACVVEEFRQAININGSRSVAGPAKVCVSSHKCAGCE